MTGSSLLLNAAAVPFGSLELTNFLRAELKILVFHFILLNCFFVLCWLVNLPYGADFRKIREMVKRGLVLVLHHLGLQS